MDATTRWETEALRRAPTPRSAPPKPSRTRAREHTPSGGEWVTLREAELATGIPTNTLRKWVRRSGLASYLESDGELQVRMVDLGAVRARARALGRHLTPPPHSPDGPPDLGVADTRRSPEDADAPAEAVRPTRTVPDDEPDRSGAEPPPGTMIVPVDAWNKMLAQLGNLHEAGQQLAEARERAAKAETEAAFLRERLADMRSEAGPRLAAPEEPDRSDAPTPPLHDDGRGGVPERSPATPTDHGSASDGGEDTSSSATTSYWRYLTTGWRRRTARGNRD